jgi:hypothetical protein
MSTATVTLTKVDTVLPAANTAFAGTVVTLTDSAGNAQPPVTLTGKEVPAWTAVFMNVAAVAGAQGTVTAQDIDDKGSGIGVKITQAFTEIGSPATFPATSAITVVIA